MKYWAKRKEGKLLIYFKRFMQNKGKSLSVFLCLCVLFIGMFIPSSATAQMSIDWPLLSNVSYEYIQNLDQNFWYGKATFGEEVLALDGKEVSIKGYIIPADVGGGNYYLSAYPFSTCFFCGGAGQESVMELRLKKKKERFAPDEFVTLTGTLQLNDRELELNYILENAKRE